MPFAEHHKLSFSGYHTEKETASAPTPWITGLCPMFDEKAATAILSLSLSTAILSLSHKDSILYNFKTQS